MKPEPINELDIFRRAMPTGERSPAGTNYGIFVVSRPTGNLLVMSSGGADTNGFAAGWEHVSVSLADRCPTWREMAWVKDLFWMPERNGRPVPSRKVELHQHQPTRTSLVEAAVPPAVATQGAGLSHPVPPRSRPVLRQGAGGVGH